MSYFRFQYKIKKFNSGYYPGFNQASTIIEFQCQPTSDEKNFELNEKKIQTTFIKLIKALDHPPPSIQIHEDCQFFNFLELPISFLKASRYPIFFNPAIISKKNNCQYEFIFPAIQHSSGTVKKIFEFTEMLLNQIELLNLEEFLKKYNELIKQIKHSAPAGINTLRFINAAHKNNIPWFRVYQNVYQFGWGKYRRWLDSSFTDKTSNITAGLVRNKLNTSSVLNLAGFPVPQSFVVTNLNELYDMSKFLGFPVVIKPIDLDGGVGVRAGLKNQEDLNKAFDHAKKYSKNIMVQKHIPGKDYRIQVFNGEAYWAIERQVCSVIGDGYKTVKELIDNENLNRGKGSKNEFLVKIDLNDETIDLLKENNLDINSVPKKNCVVILKRSANVTNGGVPVPVLENAHQDNLTLAIDAAKIVGLDLAGIDLICEDISISWKKSIAAICEVNAQPQLASHLPEILLGKILDGNGRIPAIACYGDLSKYAHIKKIIQSEFSEWGWVSSQKIETKSGYSLKQLKANKSFYRKGMPLILDKKVDCLVLEIDEEDFDYEFPVDRFDLLILGDFFSEKKKFADDKLRALLSISNKCLTLNKANIIEGNGKLAEPNSIQDITKLIHNMRLEK